MGDEQRFWRVYVREWVVAYISDTDGRDGMKECIQRFSEVYEGKVRPEEWRVEPWSLKFPPGWPWMLMLLLPVMKAEYVSRPLALDCARKIDGRMWLVTVVLEGSKADKKLLNYGKRMLREGSGDGQELDAEGSARGAEGDEGRAGA
jgi:hypothetical protein